MKKLLFALLTSLTAACGLIQYSVQDVVEVGFNSTVYVSTELGHCTGFAVDYDIVVTAAHCVDYPNVYMQFGSKAILGEVLIDDDDFDYAVIHTTERIPGIVPLLLNDSKLKPGERLISTGFPFYTGKEITFSIGNFVGYTGPELVATDVCLRGNSGGPVMDELGRVVGVCSRISPMIDIYDGFHHSHRDINILVPIKYIKQFLNGDT